MYYTPSARKEIGRLVFTHGMTKEELIKELMLKDIEVARSKKGMCALVKRKWTGQCPFFECLILFRGCRCPPHPQLFFKRNALESLFKKNITKCS